MHYLQNLCEHLKYTGLLYNYLHIVQHNESYNIRNFYSSNDIV